jgi:hypothetical protein
MDEENKTKFKSQIDEKNQEFETLLAKFRNMADPVERYIKRLEMKKLKNWLSEYGLEKNVP